MEESHINGNPIFEKVLIDVENGVYVDEWSLSSSELQLGGEWRIEKHRLHGGVSDGVDIITINNGKLSFVVVPTRGMSIWKGEYEGVFLGWNSPVKSPVHPSYINLEAKGGLGWLDGFNEMIVRCGLEYFGPPGKDVIIDDTGRKAEVMLTLHGRIANIPASTVKVRIYGESPVKLEIEGVVYERSMFGANLKMTSSIMTVAGSNSFRISDTIENLRGVPSEMQILYHCNFGSPILEEGSRFVAPIKRLAPRDPVAAEEVEKFDYYGPPTPGFIEQVYYMDLLADDRGETLAVLTNSNGDKAVSISYSVKELPHFTLWKNTASIEDGYVTGLEPGTSFPNVKPFERSRGRVINLKPGEKFHSGVTISIHLGSEAVGKVLGKVDEIRGDVQPEIFRKPIGEFSPV